MDKEAFKIEYSKFRGIAMRQQNYPITEMYRYHRIAYYTNLASGSQEVVWIQTFIVNYYEMIRDFEA
jgi:hypothetical protein